MSRTAEAWLARLSDPEGENRDRPARPFPVADRAGVDGLMHLAIRHNVHLVTISNLLAVLRTSPQSFLYGEASAVLETGKLLQDSIDEIRKREISHNMLLAGAAREVLAAMPGLPVALVKGLDFAEVVYRGLHRRKFGDIDLLVDPACQAEINLALSGLGYREVRPTGKKVTQTERQWIRPGRLLSAALVEVHTDMVHSPELRAHMSLDHRLYAGAEAGGISGAARMILAALHGATSHLFGRLQYVVDGMMVARTGVDPAELRERARQTGALLPVCTMLRLAHEIYGCAACGALLDEMRPAPSAALERRLITASMAIAAKSRFRMRFLPQRYIYRQLMRAPRQNRPPPASDAPG